MAERYWVGGTASWNGTAGTKWSTTSGGGSGAAEPTASDNVHFDAASGAVTVTVATTTALCLDIDFTGFTGTFAGSTAMTVSGSMTLAAGMTRTYTGVITFNATSGTKIITSNGKALDSAVTFNGVGGTWQLADAFVTGSTRTTTLTNGSLDANNKNVTTGLLSSSNSNVRTLLMGSGTWTLSGSGTVWNFGITNLTLTPGTSLIDLTDATASTKIFQTDGATVLNDWRVSGNGSGNYSVAGCTMRDVTIANTGGAGFTSVATWTARNVSFAGATVTFSGSFAWNVSGNWTMGSGVTRTWTGGLTFNGTSGTQTVTSSGITMASAVTMNGVGGTAQLQDAFTTSSTITLTNGSLDTNGFNVTCTVFSSTNSNTRVLTLGATTWTVTSTGTVWNITTATNLTLSGASATVKITDASASSKTFQGGGKTYGTLWLTGAGSGTFILAGSNFFSTALKMDTPPHTLQFTAGTTQTLGSGSAWQITGTVGNLMTMLSTSNGSAWNLSSPSGVIHPDYLSLRDSAAAGGSPWFAGSHSTNVSGNTGWIFTDSEVIKTETVTHVDTKPMSLARTIVDAITSGDTVTRALVRTIAESTTMSDTITREIARTITEAITAADVRTASLERTITDGVSSTDTVLRALERAFAESEVLADVNVTYSIQSFYRVVLDARVLADRADSDHEVRDILDAEREI